MIKRTIITGFLLSCVTASSFANPYASQAEEDSIASACKPYLEQYSANINPDKLPAAAQAALKACKEHGSCMTRILSNPTTGIANCASKLDRLQPNQSVPLVIITPLTQKAPPPPKATPAWYIGSPGSQSTQEQPAATNNVSAEPPPAESAPAETASPPANTNQPLGVSPSDQKQNKTQPSINWF